MLHLPYFHKLGRQALSVLWLCVKNKTKRDTYKTQIDGVTEDKKNIDETIAENIEILSIKDDLRKQYH